MVISRTVSKWVLMEALCGLGKESSDHQECKGSLIINQGLPR